MHKKSCNESGSAQHEDLNDSWFRCCKRFTTSYKNRWPMACIIRFKINHGDGNFHQTICCKWVRDELVWPARTKSCHDWHLKNTCIKQMLGSEENRKERKKVFVQFCEENIYQNYLYIVISRNQSRNNKEFGSIQHNPPMGILCFPFGSLLFLVLAFKLVW